MRQAIFLTYFWIGQFFFFTPAQAQQVANPILHQNWKAQWITHPNVSGQEYGVYGFSKTFEISTLPSTFKIHVSADNRYKLYLNGELISFGPSRGDINHWNYETLDLKPHLVEGSNHLFALVWNEGEFKQEAQISLQTGFILQGHSSIESILNTNSSWLVRQDLSYRPLPHFSRFYYVSGPGEIRELDKQISMHQRPSLGDSQWFPAKSLGSGVPKELQGPYGTVGGWMLVPSTLPPLERKAEPFAKAILFLQDPSKTRELPTAKSPWIIPANTKQVVLLDQGYLTNAFPHVRFRQGKKASLTLQYAESLYSTFPSKGNRNEIAGKWMVGRQDSLISAGVDSQQFEPLTYRTYRYVQLSIQTADEPLVLEEIHSIFTGYPFVQASTVKDGSSEIQSILDIGWRTARLCAMDTYMDCPYYEQLQYIGDGRIQALVSLYNSQDDRLVKNALAQADYSRQPEGITLSRHPSHTPQYIPTFSLWYIGMLHDYGRYGKDQSFVRDKIPGMRQILSYFQKYQLPNGSLKGVPHWMFTDWVDQTKDWNAGVGPVGADGTSALFDLTLLYALQKAVELEKIYGHPAWATVCQESAEALAKTIRLKYWHATQNRWADREEKDVFSQHTLALAILTGLERSQDIAKTMFTDTSLAQASIYFKYYVHEALIQVGLGNKYWSWLDKWRENIQMGLTTWAEKSDVDRSRSDCHAWGSSPNIEFFRTVLGIDSDGPGFSKVKIKPHLGSLTKIGGSIPHPHGEIVTHYQKESGKWSVRIHLPDALQGTLVWKNQILPLHGGENIFQLQP